MKIILLLIVIFCIILGTIYFFHYNRNIDSTEVSFFIGNTKDIFQILFFIVAGLITILSYIQAKKTLFTPIKTETFKMQIKAFEEILAFFQTKTETDFISKFDFNFMFHINAKTMVNDFIYAFFKNEIKINEDAFYEEKSKIAGAVVTQEYALKNFISPEYYEKTKHEDEKEITNPAMQLERWKQYDYGHIIFSKQYEEESAKLTQLIASPLIPKQLKDKIEFFDNKVKSNLYQIGKTLTLLAKELPEKLPTADSIINIDPAGLWNKYNHDCEYLEPIAKDILLYIRAYLKIDNLIE